MAFRFQRRIKIAPGIRLNVSKRGVGLSAGPRGATMSVGRRGVYGNVGVPGTGLSFREKLNKTQKGGTGGRKGAQGEQGNINISIDDDGLVTLLYPTGEPLSTRETAAVRKRAGGAIRAFMEEVCERRNEMLRSITTFHHRIPKPTDKPEYIPSLFKVQEPTPSLFAKVWALIFPPFRRKLNRDHADWRSAKAAHDQGEQERKALEETLVFSDITAMERVLETYLGGIEWPKEPAIDFDLGEDNTTLALDIQFPDEDEMPDKEWSVPATQYKLSPKTVSATKRRQIYRDYIHSVMMRVAGEIFAHLPTVEHVLISGYRETINSSNGHAEDQYIISVIMHRDQWASVDFERLRQIDPTEVFTGHLLNRSMKKTGIFKGITPFSPSDLEESSMGSGHHKLS
ncbi:DUF4236 domain-containing protein [uncultured Marinobacter sp.]|uniref:DUF4236 domain-containing protein n=1 Tax=uncultured Marinobacter sp. TaxID=187379 RepID=UPI0030DBAE97